MRQVVCNVFITYNHTSFRLQWKKKLVKHQKISRYYDHDCILGFCCIKLTPKIVTLVLLGSRLVRCGSDPLMYQIAFQDAYHIFLYLYINKAQPYQYFIWWIQPWLKQRFDLKQHTYIQTDRQTDRQAGRQACRQTDRQAGRQTGRHAGRQTDRKADIRKIHRKMPVSQSLFQ